MSIRIKTISTFSVVCLLGTVFLWSFNIFYVLRDWGVFGEGLSTFIVIVLGLIVVSDIVFWFLFKPAAAVEKKMKSGEDLTEQETAAFDGMLRRMPLAVSLVSGVGFFLGPLIKRVISAITMGKSPLTLVTLTSIIFSISIGLYIAFIIIRLIEGYFQPLQLKQDRKSIDSMKNKSWSQRQYMLGFTIFILTFGLFFSAGQGYLLEELYAPAKIQLLPAASAAVDEVSAASEAEDEPQEVLPLDTVSAASETVGDRQDLWIRALNGENLNLNETHPQIVGRLSEYTMKMVLLGLIIVIMSLLAMMVETRTTKKRMDEMNERLMEIAEGNVDKDRKLLIIQADEFGRTSHWINRFIDKQAELFKTVLESIAGLDMASEDLIKMSETAARLGSGIDEGITGIRKSLEIQHSSLENVDKNVSLLGETIARTNENVHNQHHAMSNNSASMEEMVASVSSVSKNSENAFNNTLVLRK